MADLNSLGWTHYHTIFGNEVLDGLFDTEKNEDGIIIMGN